MSDATDTPLNTDKAFGMGLMFGQIAVHCEHVLSGGKLAAQIGCSRDNVGLACDAIRREGCQFIVDEKVSSDRVSIWIYKKAIAETLIRVLDRESAPSLSGAIISGKLFGYADNEIEDYVTEHFPQSITAGPESEPNSLRDLGTGD
ncbi:MAG: hypothetical protein ABR920_16630 [Terriglobales bacterium]